MPRTAKLFRNGRSQAVRLPANFRFEGHEVFIRQDPATGDIPAPGWRSCRGIRKWLASTGNSAPRWNAKGQGLNEPMAMINRPVTTHRLSFTALPQS